MRTINYNIMWLYGTAFSLSCWFITLKLSLFFQLLPLVVAAIISLLYAMKEIRAEQNPSVELAALATSVLFMILFWTKPDDYYWIFSIVFAIITMLTVVANIKILFIAPPAWLGGANAISLILTVVVYIMFYAGIQNHIENFFVLIPIGILAVVELYIILNIKNMPDINEKMKSRLRTQRVTYMIALIIVFVTTMLYISDIISLEMSLLVCVISYSLGLLYSTSTMILSVVQNKATTQQITFYTFLRNQEV